MKKILLLFTILFVSVITTACINNFAVQELNNKAESYINQGDSETAICRLKSSLDLDNEVYQTHYNLAVAYNNTGNYEECLTELKKVLELNPDFADAYYTMALAREALAYRIIEKDPDNDGNIPELTLQELLEFNTQAAVAVETYNQYLVQKANAPETDQINAKIAEINQKIKEYTDIYDNKNNEQNARIEREISPVDEDIPQENDG